MNKDEKQSQFVVLSSLLLRMSSESFPSQCLINETEVLRESKKFNLYSFFEPSNVKLLSDTIKWLSDEGYIRSRVVEKSWYITLSEKGMNAIDFSIVKPDILSKYNLSKSVNRMIAGGKDGHGEQKGNGLKLTKPATTFIPSDWLD